MALKKASIEFKNDKEIVKAAVSKNGKALEFASPELKNDKEIVLIALSQTANALEFVGEQFKSDSEIINAAVKSWDKEAVIKFCSPTIDNYRETVIQLLPRDGLLLEFVTPDLRNDKEVVLTAIRDNRLAYKFVSNELKVQDEIITASLPECWKFVPKSCKKSKQLTLLVVKKLPSTMFKDIYKPFQKDFDVIKKAIDGSIDYSLLPKSIQSNIEIIKYAAQTNSRKYYKSFPEIFQKNREIALISIQSCGLTIGYIHNDFRNDKDLAMKAVEQNGEAYDMLQFIFKNDIEYFKVALNDKKAILRSFPKVCDDKNLIIEYLKRKPDNFSLLPQELKADKDVALCAVTLSGNLIRLLHNDLTGDVDIATAAIRQNGTTLILESVSHSLKNDLTFAKVVLLELNLKTSWFPQEIRDKAIYSKHKSARK